MKKSTPILLALFLFASCSKEKHCGSVYGTVEIYSDKYGQVTITGNKVNRDYFEEQTGIPTVRTVVVPPTPPKLITDKVKNKLANLYK